MVERARSYVAHGKAKDGVLILMLSKGEDGEAYDISMVTTGLRATEIVSLLEFAKHDVLNWRNSAAD